MATVSDIACHSVLDELQHRNGAVEILGVPANGDQTGLSWHKVRLLQYGEAGLVIERPFKPEAAQHIRPGRMIRVLAVLGRERWQFLSHVKNALIYNLNPTTRVAALELTPPVDVQSGQRRQYYRVVNVAGVLRPALLTPLPAQPAQGTHEAEAEGPAQPRSGEAASAPGASSSGSRGRPAPAQPKQPSAAPLVGPRPTLALAGGSEDECVGAGGNAGLVFPPQPFHAKVLNISGGGMCVEAPQRLGAQIQKVAYYRCSFTLPTHPAPLEPAARLHRLERCEGDTYLLGLEFEFLSPAQRRRSIDAICKFSAWHQRQQLQRQRDKEIG